MNTQRSKAYKKFWQELIDYYGARCFYCHKEIATTIDHVVPYSWDADNAIENLVPACALCNSLASNKMFDSVEEKRQYILNELKRRKNQRAICSGCMLPFAYRMHSPSMLLCAECYDEEYGTACSETREWKKWIRQLRAAGIPAEAHRKMKIRLKNIKRKDRDVKLETLIDEYSYVLDGDEDFALTLM